MKRIVLLLLLLCFFIPGRISAQDPNVTLLSRSEDQIRFRYTVPSFQRKVVVVKNASFLRYEFQGVPATGKPGEPEIPVATLLFAVPENAEIQVQVLNAEQAEEGRVKLLPVPFTIKKDEVDQYRYSDNYPSIPSEDWFPQRIVQIGKPAYSGNFRVVQIHVPLLQFNPQNLLTKRLISLEAELRFVRSPKRSQPEVGPGAVPAFLLSTVENADQAAQWYAKQPKKRLRKGKASFVSGIYYKIPIQDDGLYKITGKFLKDNGIDISGIDPATVKIFNNGGRTLPLDLNAARPDSLIENAILVYDGNDGRFDESDYILFAGKSVSGWEFDPTENQIRHYINPYTFTNVYWLVLNDGKAGKRMPTRSPSSSPVVSRSTYKARQFIEHDKSNLHNSGREWYGEKFSSDIPSHAFQLNLNPLVQENHVAIRGRLIGWSRDQHRFQVSMDGQSVGSSSFYGITKYDFEMDAPITLAGSEHNLELQYTPATQVSSAYLDWLEVSATAKLILQDQQLDFWSEPTAGTVEYVVQGATENQYYVLNVNKFNECFFISPVELQNDKLVFRVDETGVEPQHYWILAENEVKDVTAIFPDDPSDLRNPQNGADFLIITHEDFADAAYALKNLRETHDGLATMVVNIGDVYDEFAAGLFDPTAIRDFLRFVFDNWRQVPQYVLFFGDGDYDYRNLKETNDANWIPPYETDQMDEISNRTTDDWFAYVHGDDSVLDFSIGRLPVQTPEEALQVVEKLVEYSTKPPMGFWKNQITIVADDEIVTGGRGNETIHTRDAEDLAENYVPRRFDLDKIYLTEFPVVYDASVAWVSKPAATEALLNSLNQGSLIINFIGHGNPHVWTHERVLLDSRDKNRIQNGSRYGFWITATCDFGRWDDPENESFAETLLKMEGRGAIGLLASARLVYASSNAAFNKQFMQILLQKPEEPLRLGDAMRLAKLYTYNTSNNEKFHLLGDPTLRLASPTLSVLVNDISPDSLKALSKITLQGQVGANQQSSLQEDGTVFIKAFDSRRSVTYTTSAGSTIRYVMPGNHLFRGKGETENGQFLLQFIVPKDITYGGTQGRISLYFEGDGVDGAGYLDDLIVDGTATDLIDTKGPSIFFEVEDQPLYDFAVLNADQFLKIIIEDDHSGINITGDVGHQITVVPDENMTLQKDVTYLFEYDKGSYLKGSLLLPLSSFSEWSQESEFGQIHSLTIKAWDNANNSATAKIQFELASGENLVLRDVLNYPNPFRTGTTFSFYLNHDAEVQLKIYTLSGMLIRNMDNIFCSFGFNQIPWDGLDQDGDELANGVYFFQLRARNDDKKINYIGKIVKIK